MSAYLRETTSVITKIGYKDGSRPVSMALSESSIVLEDVFEAPPSPKPTADVLTDVKENGIEGDWSQENLAAVANAASLCFFGFFSRKSSITQKVLVRLI